MNSAGRTLVWVLVGVLAVAAGAGILLLLTDTDGGAGGPVEVVEDGGPARDPTLPAPATEVDDRRPVQPTEVVPDHGTLVGRIVTEDRRAIPGAGIDALAGTALQIGAIMTNLPPTGASAEAGADGRFVLTGVPTNTRITLRVNGDSFQLTDAGPYRAQGGGQVDVGDIVVSKGLRLRGLVLDRAGRKIADAEVGLHYVSTASGWIMNHTEPVLTTVTDEDGEFTFDNVRQGGHSVEVAAEGYARAMVRGGVSPEETLSERWVTVTLETPEAIIGTVVSRRSLKPLAGVRVFAEPITYDAAPAVTESNENGEYRFDTLAPGKYRVVAIAPGFRPKPRDVLTGNALRQGLLRMVRNGSISGFVLDPDGRPVRNFDLLTRYHITAGAGGSAVGSFQRFTDSEGAFTAEDLREGFYSFEVWSKGYALTRTEPMLIEQGEVLEGYSVQLYRGSEIRGLIVDGSGTPVPNASVTMQFNRHIEITLLPDDDEDSRVAWLRTTRSDRSGRFVLADTTDGMYQLIVDHPDYAVVKRDDILVRAGQDTDISEPFVIHRGATLIGVAMTHGGMGVRGALVSVADGKGFSDQTRADLAGRFRFERLPPGTYFLSATGERGTGGDFASVIQAALNQREQRDRNSVELSPGATVERSVTISF